MKKIVPFDYEVWKSNTDVDVKLKGTGTSVIVIRGCMQLDATGLIYSNIAGELYSWTVQGILQKHCDTDDFNLIMSVEAPEYWINVWDGSLGKAIDGCYPSEEEARQSAENCGRNAQQVKLDI